MSEQQETYDHLMVDIETLSTGSCAVITSIAAVPFNMGVLSGQGKAFYEKVDIDSSLSRGMNVSGSTLRWWFDQPHEAQQAMLANAQPLEDVLALLEKYVTDHYSAELQVWCNGLSFDFPRLKDAFDLCDRSLPWEYWQERDMRTIVSLAPKVKEAYARRGTPHNALDDCYNQIRLLRGCMAHISVNVWPLV